MPLVYVLPTSINIILQFNQQKLCTIRGFLYECRSTTAQNTISLSLRTPYLAQVTWTICTIYLFFAQYLFPKTHKKIISQTCGSRRFSGTKFEVAPTRSPQNTLEQHLKNVKTSEQFIPSLPMPWFLVFLRHAFFPNKDPSYCFLLTINVGNITQKKKHPLQ